MSRSHPRPRLLNALRKYIRGTATLAEKKLLDAYYAFFDRRPDVLSELDEAEADELGTRMKEYILARTDHRRTLWSAAWLPGAAAAVLLVLIAGGSYYLFRNQTQQEESPVAIPVRDIDPGGNRALLTLSDGTVVVLDSAANGLIAHQDNVDINKTADGQIAYKDLGTGSVLQYNTISTPAGGQFKVQLPDGSLVWLNASSSIRFPTRFPAGERKIYITGEVFCEVTKDPSRPFRVQADDLQLIEVLGTSFGLNAYADEPAVRTTLVEGSLKVSSIPDSRQHLTLRPGQRASLAAGKDIRLEENVNVNQDIAWKNGLFQFEDTELTAVMRQLARWYDVRIVYEGHAPSTRFSGKIYKNITAAQALDILRFTGVRFRIEGPSPDIPQNRIIVTP